MSVEDIVQETQKWPAEQIEELVARLNGILNGASQSENDAAWRKEIRRRLAEIDNGRVQLRDGAEVSARIRKIVSR
jgi:hypothetical protein